MEPVAEEKGIIQVQEQRGRGGGGIIKQSQNLNHHQQQNQQNHPPPPPAQPQKCPRCDSLNTKFCYYNNYSLSQPRYFCKTCRRYWTQGGTLRNVPVGGGCRKGKRMKKSSSSPSSSDTSGNQGITSATPISVDSSRYNKPIDTISSSLQPTVPPFAFPGGGFLSSLAGIQSFNAEFGGSNLALLQGFAHPSFLHQHHQQRQQQLQFDEKPTLVFNMGSREALEENGIQATSHHQEWPQSFNNSSSSTMITSEQSAGFWSNNTTNTTTTTNNNTTTSGAGSSLNLNQTHHWVDLPGFGAPPPTSSSSPSFL